MKIKIEKKKNKEIKMESRIPPNDHGCKIFQFSTQSNFFKCKIKAEQETINECEYSKMVWRTLGVTDMSVLNLLDLTIRCSKLEIRSDVNAQTVFHKQFFTRVTIGKYATGLVCYKNCTSFAQNMLNRL